MNLETTLWWLGMALGLITGLRTIRSGEVSVMFGTA
jgi:hypothetical protein